MDRRSVKRLSYAVSGSSSDSTFQFFATSFAPGFQEQRRNPVLFDPFFSHKDSLGVLALSSLLFFIRFLPFPIMASTFEFSSTALEVAEANKASIEGKVFVVTGAYSGIGLEATKALLTAGGTVVLTGRSESLLQETVEALKKEGFDGAKIDGGCTIDLADLDTVKAFAKYVKGKYDRIVLICNAGVMATPPGVTKQGFEQQFGINVIGHFLLAKLLVDKTSRQVWLSSSAHRAVRSETRALSRPATWPALFVEQFADASQPCCAFPLYCFTVSLLCVGRRSPSQH
jgi:short chain dehydrogenase